MRVLVVTALSPWTLRRVVERRGARSFIRAGVSEYRLIRPRGLWWAGLTVAGWRCEQDICEAVRPVDYERMTGLPIDQLLDITASVAPLLNADEVACWTGPDLFESVVAMVTYARQNATEDFISAILDTSGLRCHRAPPPLDSTAPDTSSGDGPYSPAGSLSPSVHSKPWQMLWRSPAAGSRLKLQGTRTARREKYLPL